jgi:uroporphyrinogen-III synthase
MAITRSGQSVKEFSDLVILEGGRVFALPTIDIIPTDPKVVEEIIQLITRRNHDICAFLSANAVEVLFDLACKTSKVKHLLSLLNRRTIIAIGPNTKKRLEEHQIKVHIVPEKYSTEGLIEMFSSNIRLVAGKSIIIPRSGESDALIKTSLLNLGMSNVDEIFLYNVKSSETDSAIWGEFISLLTKKSVDCIVFTSPSAVKAFFKIVMNNNNLVKIETELNEIKMIIAIGPRTWQELERRGIRAFIAENHTIRGAFELARTKLS